MKYYSSYYQNIKHCLGLLQTTVCQNIANQEEIDTFHEAYIKIEPGRHESWNRPIKSNEINQYSKVFTKGNVQ